MSIDIDYPAFCRLLRVQNKLDRVVPFVPTENQRARAERRTSRDLVLKHKQTGATTEELARSLWHFLARPDAHVVVAVPLVPDYNRTAEVAALIEALGDGLPPAFFGDGKRTCISEWRRGDAFLRVLYGDVPQGVRNAQGVAITRLHVHEAAWMDDDGVGFLSLIESVAPDGEIAIQSSPGPGAAFDSMVDQARRGASSFSLIELPIHLPAQPPSWHPLPHADAATA